MNEKPLHLPMSFGEALSRLVRVPKKKKASQGIDYKKLGEKNENGATKKPRRSAGKSDPVD